jgi:hypothetical protein
MINKFWNIINSRDLYIDEKQRQRVHGKPVRFFGHIKPYEIWDSPARRKDSLFVSVLEFPVGHGATSTN